MCSNDITFRTKTEQKSVFQTAEVTVERQRVSGPDVPSHVPDSEPPSALETVLEQTTEERTARSGCASKSKEKERQKNREEARQREKKEAAMLEKFLVKETKKEKMNHPVTQAETEYLQELRRAGQVLEIQAIRYVKDPVTARRIFQHIQRCTYNLKLLDGALQQASFRHHALMPRLLAEGKLTEREVGVISSTYEKTLLSLSGIQDIQDSIREWIKSFLPEGKDLGGVSDSQIAGFEQAVAERALKHRDSSRPDKDPEENPDDVVGAIAARRQIFAEWNTTLPKTLTNFAVQKAAFSRPRPHLFTYNSQIEGEEDASKLGYSQHDYNLFVGPKRAELLKHALDSHIQSAKKNSENQKLAPRSRAFQEAKLDLLSRTRQRIETMTPQEGEQEIQRYLASLSENCNWSRRLPPNIVELILDSKDHRIKTQFETGTSEASKDYQSREDLVREDFGADTTSMEVYEHENYGYLSDKDLDRELASNNMDSYGTVLVTFNKEKLRERTTMTLGDSLVTFQNGALPCMANQPDASVVTRFNYVQVLSTALEYNGLSQEQRQVPNIREHVRSMDVTGLAYVEMQYHGELKIDKDYIDQIVLIRRHFADDTEQQKENALLGRLEEKLRRAGIQNVVVLDKPQPGGTV